MPSVTPDNRRHPQGGFYRIELLAGREPTSQRTRVKNDSRKGKSQYLSCVSDVEFNSLPESRKKELKEFSDFLRK
ncbi:MAG: hypothetical protein HFH94_00900 [Lachnospiraceae bacterium]|nr:hypothetical protein [Lachnospiraceae bacterium]